MSTIRLVPIDVSRPIFHNSRVLKTLLTGFILTKFLSSLFSCFLFNAHDISSKTSGPRFIMSYIFHSINVFGDIIVLILFSLNPIKVKIDDSSEYKIRDGNVF